MSLENAVKAVVGLIILLGLGLAGGDIRKFPAVIGLLLKLAFWAVGLAFAGAVIFLLVTRNRRKQAVAMTPAYNREAQPTQLNVTQSLEKIDWYQFEKVVARLLMREGLRVDHRGGAKADGGVDLIAQSPINGGTELIQCKFWKSWDLNLKTIRELLGARESAEFKPRNASATIYTLSEPTTAAFNFARANNIRIVSRGEIENRIVQASINQFPELLNPANKSCPRCDAPMVNRGNFWGCSNYGRYRCRGIIKVES